MKDFISILSSYIRNSLIYWPKNKNNAEVRLFIDFKKAFKSLEWDFLHKLIQKFNFSQTFLQRVNTFYSESEAMMKNNV